MTKSRTESAPDAWLVELTRIASGRASLAARCRARAAARPWTIVVLALGVLLASSATVLLIGSRARGVDHPDHCDQRVAPFVELVERERGLRFDHPVYVDFLPPERFLSSSAPADLDLEGQDHATIEDTARLLHALGVVGSVLDLETDSGRLRGTPAPLGYYSPSTQRVGLRGTELTPALQAALVHELTHALQDQHVDITSRLADLEGDPAKQSAFRALLEGDADRVEAGWRATLDDAAQQLLEADVARLQPPADRSSAVPSALRTLVGAPDRLGALLVDVVRAAHGERGIDDMFLTPPSTQEHLLDPWSLVQDHQGSLAVAAPLVRAGDERFQEGTFGAVSWLVLLASRVAPEDALAAARGWGGDAYVAFRRDGTDCARISYAADTPADRTRMRATLRLWVERGPRASAHVERRGQQLVLESCAPKRATEVGADRSHAAMDLAVLHTEVSLALVRKGFDPETARCGSDRLLELTADRRDATLSHARVLRRVVHPCLPDGTD